MVSHPFSQGKSILFSEFIKYFGSEKPIDFMQFIIDISNDTLLPFGGFLITLYVAFIWKKKNLSNEISKGNPTYRGSLMEKYINFSVTIVCPLILGSIFIPTFLNKFLGYNYSNLSDSIGSNEAAFFAGI